MRQPNNTKMNEWMNACMQYTHKAVFTLVSISVWIHHVKNMFRFSNDKKWHQEQRFNANHAMPYHGMPYYNVCSWYEMIRWMTAWNLCFVCIFYNVIFWIHKNVVYAVPLLWGWFSYVVVLFLNKRFFFFCCKVSLFFNLIVNWPIASKGKK